jgi:hypothetical protein
VSIISSEKRRESKIILLLAVFLLLVLFFIMPPVLEGLFFIISGKASQVVSGLFNIAGGLSYFYAGQSASQIAMGSTITLYAYWSGNASLDYAWIATNETGAWENKSIYGSPVKMSGFSGWSNFTWDNPSFSGNAYWRICANTTQGNMNCTQIMNFNVIMPAPPIHPGVEGVSGGGPKAPGLAADFTVDKDFLKASVKQGETVVEHVKVNNTGGTTLSFNLSVDALGKSVMLSDYSFTLLPGESKSIAVAFIPRDDVLPDIYTGSLVVKAGNITKSVMLVMETKPRKSLFDIYVNLEKTSLEAVRGEEVEADILMYNFGEIKPTSITLYYSLRDFNGRDLFYNREAMSVEEQKLVKRSIKIPEDAELGFYQFYARVEYGNQTAASGGLIKVVEEKPEIPKAEYGVDYLAIMILLAAIIASITVLIWKIRKHRKERLPFRDQRDF